WREAGLPTWPIAVNLADMQFRDIGFVDSLEQMLREHGIDGELLELEISERMLVDDVPEVRRRLLRLKKLGIRLAVDDFGTGYFSPRHLKELPVDKIKIDRAFVRDLPHARDSAAIAGAIIQMAGALGKRVIAEGVENESQRALLAELGCHEIQGDVVSAPLPADGFEAWLSSRPGSLRLRPMPA
ncbi:MAG TPA: EAL domain-containing protein, partial [Burkholderiaceae bacterium]